MKLTLIFENLIWLASHRGLFGLFAKGGEDVGGKAASEV